MAGIDWDKIDEQKRKLEDKLSNGGGSGVVFWKVSPGDNVVRIMPGWTDEGDFKGQFWREVHQHWQVSDEQKGPVLCAKKTPFLNGTCAVCDFIEELKKHDDNLRAVEIAKDIRAKTAYLLNVVDKEDGEYTAKDVAEFKKNKPDEEVPFEVGDAKVQVYAAPATVFNQVLNAIKVNRVDITSLEDGHDVIISKSGRGFKTRYQTSLVLKPSKAPDGKLNDLSRVGFLMDEEKQHELLSSGVGGEFVSLLAGDDSSPAVPADSGDAGSDTEDLRARLQAEISG